MGGLGGWSRVVATYCLISCIDWNGEFAGDSAHFSPRCISKGMKYGVPWSDVRQYLFSVSKHTVFGSELELWLLIALAYSKSLRNPRMHPLFSTTMILPVLISLCTHPAINNRTRAGRILVSARSIQQKYIVTCEHIVDSFECLVNRRSIMKSIANLSIDQPILCLCLVLTLRTMSQVRGCWCTMRSAGCKMRVFILTSQWGNVAARWYPRHCGRQNSTIGQSFLQTLFAIHPFGVMEDPNEWQAIRYVCKGITDPFPVVDINPPVVLFLSNFTQSVVY